MSKQNLNDDAVQSEHFFSEILNQALGFSLSKKGLKIPNQRAIDAHDLNNRVCAQFTVVNSQTKFERTIEGVEALNESRKYEKLIYLVIDFEVRNRNYADDLSFGIEQLDISGLLALINKNFSTSSHLEKLHQLITTELKSYFGEDSLPMDNAAKIERTKKGRTISACLLKPKKEIRDIPIDILIAEPNLKFKEFEVIIADITEGTFDEALKKDRENSRYFFCDLHDRLHSGLEVHLSPAIGRDVIINSNNEWQEIESTAEQIAFQRGFKKLRVKRIGHIPFYNIVEIDQHGDYFEKPIIYCRFENEGVPYDEIRFKPLLDQDWIRFFSTNGYLDLKKQRESLI